MISNVRAKYGSAQEWLAALMKDEAWLGKLQELQNAKPSDYNKFRDIAIKKMEEKIFYGPWDTYHHVGKAVQDLWDSGLSLGSMKHKAVGMLMMEWLEQHMEMGGQNNNDIQLSKELNTKRARKYFAKAIEKKYMTIENSKYRWIGTDDRRNKSELAYFLGRVFNYEYSINGNVGENFPEESLNELFGVKRLYSSLTQVYNAKKPQRWRSLIDDMFK